MLTLHAAENALDWTRLGVVAPKKRVRRAVDRNRAKRIIREAFRTSKHLLPRGLDLIVVAKRAPLSFSETRKSLVVLAGALAKRLKPPAASGAANAEPIP